MGALGTGVLAVAEGAEMWTAWALEGGWAVAVICGEKKQEGRLSRGRKVSLLVYAICTCSENMGKKPYIIKCSHLCICYSLFTYFK